MSPPRLGTSHSRARHPALAASQLRFPSQSPGGWRSRQGRRSQPKRRERATGRPPSRRRDGAGHKLSGHCRSALEAQESAPAEGAQPRLLGCHIETRKADGLCATFRMPRTTAFIDCWSCEAIEFRDERHAAPKRTGRNRHTSYPATIASGLVPNVGPASFRA